MAAKIETRHQWLDELGNLSPLIKALNLKKQNDYVTRSASAKRYDFMTQMRII